MINKIASYVSIHSIAGVYMIVHTVSCLSLLRRQIECTNHNKHGTSGIWQKNLWVVDCLPVRLLVNTFFGSDCITSGRSSHHDVVNFINTYTVAMVSTVMLSIYRGVKTSRRPAHLTAYSYVCAGYFAAKKKKKKKKKLFFF